MEILNIKFKDDEKDFKLMQDLFNGIGKQALLMSHYDLAERTDVAPVMWKKFILDPRVSAVISEELELLKQSKVAIMLSTVDTNKNTGQAQLLNTLLNQTKKDNTKEGPIFIYTQVPLNKEERGAGNVVIMDAVNNIEDN